MNVCGKDEHTAGKTVKEVQLEKIKISTMGTKNRVNCTTHAFIAHADRHAQQVVLRAQSDYHRNLTGGNVSCPNRIGEHVRFVQGCIEEDEKVSHQKEELADGEARADGDADDVGKPRQHGGPSGHVHREALAAATDTARGGGCVP